MKTLLGITLLLLWQLVFVTASAKKYDKKDFMFESKEPHQMQILENGSAALVKRLQLIEKAEKTIDIEYFIYKQDRSGQLVTQALLEKAREGVKIRILIDKSILAPPLDKYVAEVLRPYDVEMRYYNPIRALTIFRIAFRTHRKLLIVDGEELIMGGRNIGDDYFEQGYKKGFSFLDRDVWVKGPIVKDVLSTFNKFWEFKHTRKVKRVKPPRKVRSWEMALRNKAQVLKARAKRVVRKIKKAWNWLKPESRDEEMAVDVMAVGQAQLEYYPISQCNHIEFVSDAPGWHSSARIFAKDLFSKFDNAEEKVVMETPYFVTLKPLRKLLRGLLNKGVELELMTNSLRSNNHPIVTNVFHTEIGGWQKRGMKTWIYTGNYIECPGCKPSNEKIEKMVWGVHSKNFLIDDKISMFGTYNLDPQSRLRSAEVGIFCHDGPEIAEQLNHYIDEHKSQSIEVLPNGKLEGGQSRFFGTSFWDKFLYVLRIIPAQIIRGML